MESGAVQDVKVVVIGDAAGLSGPFLCVSLSAVAFCGRVAHANSALPVLPKTQFPLFSWKVSYSEKVLRRDFRR